MKVRVQAKPGSSKNAVVQLDATHFVISVTQRPERGMANDAIIELLAIHLGVAKSRMHIVRGAISKSKVIEIVGDLI